jgi:hypothetical protein
MALGENEKPLHGVVPRVVHGAGHQDAAQLMAQGDVGDEEVLTPCI